MIEVDVRDHEMGEVLGPDAYAVERRGDDPRRSAPGPLSTRHGSSPPRK